MPSALGHSLRGPGSPTKTHRQCNLTKTQPWNINLNYLAHCSLPFMVLDPLPLAPLLDSLYFPGREKHKWAVCHLAQSLACCLGRCSNKRAGGSSVTGPQHQWFWWWQKQCWWKHQKGWKGWNWQIQEAAAIVPQTLTHNPRQKHQVY